MPSLVHMSKWPTQSCSLISAISASTSRAARLRHLQIERAGEMQRLDVVHPGERDVIVGPAAAHRDRDLVVAGAVERPVVHRGEPLDHVDRIALRARCAVPSATCRLQMRAMMSVDARHATNRHHGFDSSGVVRQADRITGRFEYNRASPRVKKCALLRPQRVDSHSSQRAEIAKSIRVEVDRRRVMICRETSRQNPIGTLSQTGSTPTLRSRCGRSLRRSASRSRARGCCARRAPPRSAGSSR